MARVSWSDYRAQILQKVDNESVFLSALQNTEQRGDELKASCPFVELHENKQDRHPSFTVNTERGTYYCHTCHSKGNVHTFLVNHFKMKPKEAWLYMGDELGIERPSGDEPERPPINPGLPAQYHQDLMSLEAPLRRVLKERRGLTDDTLRRFQIGWDKERLTIPIYDEFNELRNIRRYLWNAEDASKKMLNYTDEYDNKYGEVRVFGIEHLVDPMVKEVIWCEGELDRIILEQHGFKAATPTSGAGSFNPAWTKLFRDKSIVYIVQDNDEPGRRATATLAENLSKVTRVKIVQWPSDFMEKGDPTDFFIAWKQDKEAFQSLLDLAEDYRKPGDTTVVDDSIVEVHLAEAAEHQYMGKRVRIQIMCSGKDTAPYVAPRRLKISCTPTDANKCMACANAAYGGEQTLTFSATTPETLSLIQCTTNQQELVIKDMAGVNTKCGTFDLAVLEYMNIEEIRVIPQAEVNFDFVKDHEYVVRKCYYICEQGTELRANQRYMMEGYAHAEPKTQYVTHIFDHAQPSKNRIAMFEPTEEMIERLKIFQPKPGQSIREKFEEMHTDFERNITFIWERRIVGMALDLIYHTALCFYFQEQFVKRGWGELLILGDSGQAKTTIVERMMGHYQLGELHSGESSKRTGLVYSFQQTQKRWFLIWGAWPLNDTGLLVIDEFSGIHIDEIAAMSDVRSSGVAKVTGVITSETNARTRAVFLANPRNGRPLNTEPYGVMAILKLMGKAEDVRRLDLAVIVASGDVPIELINRQMANVGEVPHIYTSDLCRDRVLWCWSRKPSQIIFTGQAVRRILKEATAIGRKYSARVPLVEPADQRIKIARLAVAAAGATFSTDDGHTLMVTEPHVEFVVDLMHEIYDNPNFAYDEYSKANSDTELSPEQLGKLRSKFAVLPLGKPHEVISTLLELQYFKRQTLQDATGLPQEELLKLMHFINFHRIIEDSMSGYRKTPSGTQFLKFMKNNPLKTEEIVKYREDFFKDNDF